MDVNVMRCSRCAKQMLHAARFCPRCGLGLGAAAAKPAGYTFVAGAGGVAVAPPPPVLTVEPTVVPPPPRKTPTKARPHPPIEPKRPGPIPYPPPDYYEKAKQKAEHDRQAAAAAKHKQKSSGGGGAALFWLILIGGIIALRAGVFDKKKTAPGFAPSQHKVFTPNTGSSSSSSGATRIGPHEDDPEFVIPPHTIHLTVPPESGLRPIPPAPRLGSDTGRPLPPGPPPGYDNSGGTIVWDPVSRSYKFIPNSTGAYRNPR